MMNLVNEQNRFLTRSAQTVRGRGHDLAHLGHVTLHATEPLELPVRHFRDDVSERRFACARRAR